MRNNNIEMVVSTLHGLWTSDHNNMLLAFTLLLIHNGAGILQTKIDQSMGRLIKKIPKLRNIHSEDFYIFYLNIYIFFIIKPCIHPSM